MRIRRAARILVLSLFMAGLLASCSRPPRPDPGPPPTDTSLAGPGEFKVLPDGRLVIDKPPVQP
jgi:hypothetical protein